MATTYQLLLDGSPADDDLVDAIAAIEVEENLDLPDALRLEVAVGRDAQGELSYAGDSRLGPMANLALVVTVAGVTECVFDGYVLSHRLHLDSGLTASTLRVWCQDASWLMNLEERVREWVDLTDADVAASVFGDYGIDPAGANGDEESPSHPESGHSLMQRGTDLRFLRDLARRTGKVCRVACADSPGKRIGWFAAPAVTGEPVAVLALNDPVAPTMDELDLEWDIARPTEVHAAQALFTDPAADGVTADVTDSGLAALDGQDLAAFAGRAMSVRLTAPVDDAGELAVRARAVLRESGWFVRCEGEAEAGRVGRALRANTVVQLDGLGRLHSGKYLVSSVRHTLTADAHRMRFTLIRNAVGSPSGGPAGLLGGLLGGLL